MVPTNPSQHWKQADRQTRNAEGRKKGEEKWGVRGVINSLGKKLRTVVRNQAPLRLVPSLLLRSIALLCTAMVVWFWYSSLACHSQLTTFCSVLTSPLFLRLSLSSFSLQLQRRKIYSWSFWLKNLQLFLLLAEGKILKILPNPKPCLIQYIFK